MGLNKIKRNQIKLNLNRALTTTKVECVQNLSKKKTAPANASLRGGEFNNLLPSHQAKQQHRRSDRRSLSRSGEGHTLVD